MQFFIDKRFWSFQKLFEIDCMLYYTLHGDTNDIKKKYRYIYWGTCTFKHVKFIDIWTLILINLDLSSEKFVKINIFLIISVTFW